MKLCWHKYMDVKTQITRGRCFGFGDGLPGYRVIQKCAKCGKKRYVKLNLCMSDKDLYNESLWRD